MEAYKYFGALAVLILIVGLLFLVVRWPQGKHVTFSQHAAAYGHTVLYYNLLFTIVLPLLVLFFAGWFAPKFELPALFTFCVAASATAQYVVTLIPETGGWKTRWHRIITAMSVLLLLPAMTLLLDSPSISFVGGVTVAVGLAVMVGIMAYIAVVKGRHAYLLFFQAGYYAAFLAPILLLAYAQI